jgi:predicted kinase
MRRGGLVIGLSGPVCAGKTTVATYLRDAFGAEVVSTGEIIAPDHLEEAILAALERVAPGRPCVVDAIHRLASLRRFAEALEDRFVHLHVTAPEAVRGARGARRDPAGAEVPALADQARAVLDNRGSRVELGAQASALFLCWRDGRVPVSFQSALDVVREFQVKHGFDVATGDPGRLSHRLVLMIEELGEIARWVSHLEGDLAEEHADLLFLLLGNAIAMDFDLEEAFVRKARRILARPSRLVGGQVRILHGSDAEPFTPSRLDHLRVEGGDLPPGDG